MLVPAASSPDRRWLVCVAAPKEVEAVLRGVGLAPRSSELAIDWRAREISPRLDLVVTGVGKANAAAGLARALDPARHGGRWNGCFQKWSAVIS